MAFPDPSNEIHKLIEPVDDNEEYKATVKFVENLLRTQAKLRCERTNRRYFGEEGKPRSRRNMIYCHDWGVNAGHEHTAQISQDAALLAANCGVPLMLSVDHPDQDPVFAPDGIRFNGRGDSCHDFIYPPTEGANPAAGMRSNRGQCRTECRDYDTLVSAILLAVKHHVGVRSFIRSTAQPDREGWQAAFELYSRTFPEREIPWLDNWPRGERAKTRPNETTTGITQPTFQVNRAPSSHRRQASMTDQPQHDEAPSNELLGLISPDHSKHEKWKQAIEFVEEFSARLQKRQEYAEPCYFGKADKTRSRRTLIYSHRWIIKTEGYALTPAVAEDAIRLAANCDFELMLSSESPELGPKFGPDLIAFNGRGDAHDDFTYPPDRNDRRVSNYLGNRGRCRTEGRDYDILVSTVLLSVKHHLGNMAYVASIAEPDREGWQAAFELYSRTFPEREIPWLNNWPR